MPECSGYYAGINQALNCFCLLLFLRSIAGQRHRVNEAQRQKKKQTSIAVLYRERDIIANCRRYRRQCTEPGIDVPFLRRSVLLLPEWHDQRYFYSPIPAAAINFERPANNKKKGGRDINLATRVNLFMHIYILLGWV